jgi:RNA polymerase sigma factor (sigma-70 family)
VTRSGPVEEISASVVAATDRRSTVSYLEFYTGHHEGNESMSEERASAQGTETGREVADLLARGSAGDQRAWDQLFRRFNPMIRSVIAGFRLDHETAADVSQVVWLRLYEHSDRIRQPERLGAWLATTARNESLRCIKRLKRTRPAGVLEDEADLTAPSPDELAVDDETLQDALQALGRLPDESQQLMRLLVASPPLAYVDIAARVGRPVGSIGPTRSRCLAALRSHMVEPGVEPLPAVA